MERAPGGAVTRRTVAACTKGLAVGAVRRDPAAVRIMTGSTGVMRIRCTADQRITMTACTTRGCHLNQARMIRRCRRMRVLPRIRMARRTVAARRKGLACCGTLQRAVACAVAVGAVSKVRRGIDKRICMTADTVVRTGGRYQ
jgi:hypothetical protein